MFILKIIGDKLCWWWSPHLSAVEEADIRRQHISERHMISAATIGSLLFGRLTIFTLMWVNVSSSVSAERETGDLRKVYTQGEKMLSIQSWHIWKASDISLWRWTLRTAIFVDFYLLNSSLYRILTAKIMLYANFSVVRKIT